MLKPQPNAEPRNWPFRANYSPLDLAKRRTTGIAQLQHFGYSPQEKWTCDECKSAWCCEVSYDSYNINGDCLADK